MDSLRGFMSGELAGQSRTVGHVPRPAGKGNQRLHAVWRCWFRTSGWCNQILSAYMKITFQMVLSIVNPFFIGLMHNLNILQHWIFFFFIFMSRNQQDKKKKFNDLIFFFLISTPVYSISDTFFTYAYTSHLPQILRGASSSSRMGWLRKISLDFRHNPRISFSCSCTFLPGFAPLTAAWEHKQRQRQQWFNAVLANVGWSII